MLLSLLRCRTVNKNFIQVTSTQQPQTHRSYNDDTDSLIKEEFDNYGLQCEKRQKRGLFDAEEDEDIECDDEDDDVTSRIDSRNYIASSSPLYPGVTDGQTPAAYT